MSARNMQKSLIYEELIQIEHFGFEWRMTCKSAIFLDVKNFAMFTRYAFRTTTI